MRKRKSIAQTAYEAKPSNGHVPWGFISDYQQQYWENVVDAVLNYTTHELYLQTDDEDTLVLTGEDEGKRKCKLNKVDLYTEDDTVTIVIPENIIALNRSYFKGLFSDVITHIGTSKFRKNYRFVTKNTSIRNDIEYAISYFENLEKI
jgi:hypothetical protein